jgi:hypothetical protein
VVDDNMLSGPHYRYSRLEDGWSAKYVSILCRRADLPNCHGRDDRINVKKGWRPRLMQAGSERKTLICFFGEIQPTARELDRVEFQKVEQEA